MPSAEVGEQVASQPASAGAVAVIGNRPVAVTELIGPRELLHEEVTDL